MEFSDTEKLVLLRMTRGATAKIAAAWLATRCDAPTNDHLFLLRSKRLIEPSAGKLVLTQNGTKGAELALRQTLRVAGLHKTTVSVTGNGRVVATCVCGQWRKETQMQVALGLPTLECAAAAHELENSPATCQPAAPTPGPELPA